MMTHGVQGWSIILADLSILLFMVTVSDLSNTELKRDNSQHAASMIAIAEPLAIYRPNRQSISLTSWLAQQPADNRQRLTILVRHSNKDARGSIAEGIDLVQQAKSAGYFARLIVEPGERQELVALLAYDSDPNILARDLLVRKDKAGSESDQ